MTDNEIIKALNGSILNAKRIDCKAWSLEVYKLENALNLINSQKAEIEKLKKNIDGLNIFTKNHIKVIRLQAIKEFAERLKKRFYLCAGRFVVDVYHIDNLVKEMTEVEE